ncbi:MAG: hypothetical protein COB67_07360, partial [SAR324 cluster bacterium]
MKKRIPLFLKFLFCFELAAFALVPDRRRPQKSSEPNRYYVVPWYIHIEGVGSLTGGVAGIANILDSGTNAAFVSFQNDEFHIKIWGIDDLYLLGNYKSWSSITLSGGVTNIKLNELDSYGVGPDSSSEPSKVKGTFQFKAVQLQW